MLPVVAVLTLLPHFELDQPVTKELEAMGHETELANVIVLYQFCPHVGRNAEKNLIAKTRNRVISNHYRWISLDLASSDAYKKIQ